MMILIYHLLSNVGLYYTKACLLSTTQGPGFLEKYFVSTNRRVWLRETLRSPNNWSHLFSIVTICRSLSWRVLLLKSMFRREEVRSIITIVIFCQVWIKDEMHAEYVMHSEYSVYMFSEMFLFKCGAKHLTQASHFTNSLHFKSPPTHSSSFCVFIAQSILAGQPFDHRPLICLDCN